MELLEPREVAELLGVTEQRLADWRYRGEGPHYIKLGHRTVRYQQSDIDQWLAERTIETKER